MAINNRDQDMEEGETSERGGLLEEIPIESSKKRSAVQRRLQEFDMLDEDTKTRWKVLVAPGLCLFFGFIFGISAGVLLAGGDFASRASTASTESQNGPHMCKLKMPPGPRFPPNLLIKFEPNATFANASATDNATDNAWAALNPLGKGFVSLDENGDPIFYNGSHTPPAAQTKVVSVFHQLHCLNHLRRSLSASAANPLEFSYLVPQLSHHWDHCFDYLRQSLMCASDITLESPNPHEGGGEEEEEGLEKKRNTNVAGGSSSSSSSSGSITRPGGLTSVDGWGTVHLCRDFGVLRTWAEDYRASNDEGID